MKINPTTLPRSAHSAIPASAVDGLRRGERIPNSAIQNGFTLPKSRGRSGFTTRQQREPFAFTPRQVRGRRGFTIQQQRERFAFTLLELLVVIGIISLLIVAVVPAVTSLTKSNGINAGGRTIANILSAARSEAINGRRLVQVRAATKWLNSSGVEDVSSSYRRFSVWQKPHPDDIQQSNNPNDAYVQVSKWETLPSGIMFERDTSGYNLPPVTDPKYLGTYFLAPALNNTKAGITVPNGTAEIAWIEFSPTGAVIFPGTVPGRVYMLVTEGSWNGSSLTWTHLGHPNWLATSVDTLVGRISVVRP